MSYYFVIVGSNDNPLFEYEFGTSKAGGDGQSHFREDARRLNQFVVHSSIDIAEEVQWQSGAMFMRTIDRFFNAYISFFQTGARAKFLLLHNPDPLSPATSHLFPLSQAGVSSLTPNGPFGRPSSPSVRPLSSTSSDKTAVASSASLAPGSSSSSRRSAANSIASNPTSPQTEEAVRQFFADVYESWVKAVMSPFYVLNSPVRSPVFRSRVAAAGRKYL